MSVDRGLAGEWDGYVERFHVGRPGVTEALLARSVDDGGRTAYDWVSEDLPDGRVVDVGCGSGPTQPMVSGWVGVDRSRPELEVARRHTAEARSCGPRRQRCRFEIARSMRRWRRCRSW